MEGIERVIKSSAKKANEFKILLSVINVSLLVVRGLMVAVASYFINLIDDVVTPLNAFLTEAAHKSFENRTKTDDVFYLTEEQTTIANSYIGWLCTLNIVAIIGLVIDVIALVILVVAIKKSSVYLQAAVFWISAANIISALLLLVPLALVGFNCGALALSLNNFMQHAVKFNPTGHQKLELKWSCTHDGPPESSCESFITASILPLPWLLVFSACLVLSIIGFPIAKKLILKICASASSRERHRQNIFNDNRQLNILVYVPQSPSREQGGGRAPYGQLGSRQSLLNNNDEENR